MTSKLLVILTTGAEDRGARATLAFAMGVTACISGVEVTLFLTMSGAVWSRERSLSRVHVDGFEPLAAYVDQYREAGGKVLVCSPCSAFHCAMAPDAPLLPGAELVGLGTVVDLALDASVVTL